jgi:hypothetical protein
LFKYSEPDEHLVGRVPLSLDITDEFQGLDLHWLVFCILPPTGAVTTFNDPVKLCLVLPRCSNCLNQGPNFAKQVSRDGIRIVVVIVFIIIVRIYVTIESLDCVLRTNVDNVRKAGDLGVLRIKVDCNRFVTTINGFK